MGDSFFSSKGKSVNTFFGKKWRGSNSRKNNVGNDGGITINALFRKVTALSKERLDCLPMAKSKPELQYSREILVELMNHPLSKKKPKCLDSSSLRSIACNRNKNGNWEQSSDSHTEDEKNGENHKKKGADKAKKEQEVVLCPQRKSFNSGCYVSSNPSQNRNSTSSDNTKSSRTGSPTLPKERESYTGRDVGVRRIGSGRIMARDPMWDFRDGDSDRNQMYDKRPMDRRNDNESKYQQRDKGNRYGNDRKRVLGENNRTEETPEWFSGGPTSQHDHIELRGFDDSFDEKLSSRKNNKKSNSRSNKKNSTDSNTGSSKPTDENALKKFCQKKSPFGVDSDVRLSFSSDVTSISSHATDSTLDPYNKQRADQHQAILEDEGINPEKAFSSSPKKNEFSLEDFLKFDSFPGIIPKQGDYAEGSRFSRWFKKDSENSQLSISNDSAAFNNMVNDITGHTEAKPEADNYFTPISPESTMKLHKPRPQLKLNRSNQKEPVNQKGSSLLEILHGGAPRSVANMQDLEKCGKVHSVEELEAQLRRPTKSANKEDEMAAFKKLLTSAAAQMNKPRIPPSFLFSANAYKANNLLQVINKNAHANKISSEMKKDNNASFSGYQQHQQHQQNQQNFSANNMDSQMQIPQDLVMKLLHIQQLQHQQQQQLKQQQQQQFAKLLGSSCNTAARLTPVAPQYNSQSSASPLPPDVQMIINNAKPTPELLQRPEAQALIVGLRRGQISMYNLIEQLKKNPALQPRHREVLASIVKIHQLQTGGNGGNTERTASPVMPAPTTSSASDQMLHKVLFSQHQLRGPSPHNTNMQRVPSPRDLVAHTQNIMQTALIRKKLEEQRDNFRKRQEMQRQAVHYF